MSGGVLNPSSGHGPGPDSCAVFPWVHRVSRHDKAPNRVSAGQGQYRRCLNECPEGDLNPHAR